MNSKTTTTNHHRTAKAILRALTWAVELRREVKRYSLTDDECDAAGLPLGSVEPCAWALQLLDSPWWRVDAWGDGGCLYARALGWSFEVHHEVRQGATVAA